MWCSGCRYRLWYSIDSGTHFVVRQSEVVGRTCGIGTTGNEAGKGEYVPHGKPTDETNIFGINLLVLTTRV